MTNGYILDAFKSILREFISINIYFINLINKKGGGANGEARQEDRD